MVYRIFMTLTKIESSQILECDEDEEEHDIDSFGDASESADFCQINF